MGTWQCAVASADKPPVKLCRIAFFESLKAPPNIDEKSAFRSAVGYLPYHKHFPAGPNPLELATNQTVRSLDLSAACRAATLGGWTHRHKNKLDTEPARERSS